MTANASSPPTAAPTSIVHPVAVVHPVAIVHPSDSSSEISSSQSSLHSYPPSPAFSPPHSHNPSTQLAGPFLSSAPASPTSTTSASFTRPPPLARQLTVEDVESIHPPPTPADHTPHSLERVSHGRLVLGFGWISRVLGKADPGSHGLVGVHAKGKGIVSTLCHLSQVQTMKQAVGPIWVINVSHDGLYLATAGQDSIIRVYALLTAADRGTGTADASASTAYLNAEPLCKFSGHTGDVIDLSWSPSHFLLSASLDGTARLWHPSRPSALSVFHHPDYVTAVHFHPVDERCFLSACFDKKVRVWAIVDHRVMEWQQVSDIITAARYERRGDYLMVGTHTGTVSVLRGGVEGGGLRYVTEVVCRNRSGKHKHGRKVTGIDFCADLMLVTTNDSRLRVFHVLHGGSDELSVVQLCKLKGVVNEELQIKGKFAEDGRLVICGSEDGTVAVWDLPPEVVERRRTPASLHGSFRGHGDVPIIKVAAREEFHVHGGVVTSAQFFKRKSVREVYGKAGEDGETTRSQEIRHAIVTGSFEGEVQVYENRRHHD